MNSKQTMSKRKHSIVWNFFTAQDEIKATCNICHQNLSYKASISNLKQHMNRKHPTIKLIAHDQNSQTTSAQVVENIAISRPGISSSFNETENVSKKICSTTTSTTLRKTSNLEQTSLSVYKKLNVAQKKVIDDKLLLMITADFQPLSIVEDVGFRAYTEALVPSYTLPSRKFLSQTLLPAKYLEVYNKSKEMIKDAVSITLTTDFWTSCKNEGFLALTAHYIDSQFQVKNMLLEVASYEESHTSTNVAKEIKRIINEWGIEEQKILLTVSDNAANIKKAIIDELRWRFFGCLAHTINLIVQDALKTEDANILVTKVKDIVSYFRRSTVAKTKLDFYQRQNGCEPKKLLQSVVTRWNSVYFMCERFLEIKEEVRAALAVLGKEDLPRLTNDELERLREMVEILSPMEEVTRAMSGEKYVTLSSVIIIKSCLHSVYSELQKKTFSVQSQQIITDVINGLNKRLTNLESSSTLLISTFLDPRFKNVGFNSESVTESAKEKVSNLLTNYIASHSSHDHHEQEIQSNQQAPTSSKADSIWSSFDKKAATFIPKGTIRSRAIIELQRYLEEPILPRHCDPLIWWKSHAYNYPYLSKVVQEKFGTVATSVACERVFSKTGELLSLRRNRLTSEKVKQIMFINKNN